MKYLILLALLMAATVAQADSSQEYVFKDQPFESGSLSTDGKDFSISTVSSRGNLCDLGGRLKNISAIKEDRPPLLSDGLPFAFGLAAFALGFLFGFAPLGGFEPLFPLVRGFQGDAADVAVAEVG